MNVNRHLRTLAWAAVSGPAQRRGRLVVTLFALGAFVTTTQAGAATIASQRAVTNFTFGGNASRVPGHPNELYLTQAVMGNVGTGEDVWLRCHNCYGGHFTRAKTSGRLLSFGTNPTILMTPGTRFFIATTAPGKIGIVKRFTIAPAPIFLAQLGYECIPPGVNAQEGAQHPFTVRTVACPPELIPPPLQLLYPASHHAYSATKPLTYFVEVTGALPSDEYFYVIFDSKNKRAPGCTNFAASLHNHYSQRQFSLQLLTLRPQKGLDSKNQLGRHRWCTGPATANVLTDVNGDQNGSEAHIYSARPIVITP